MPNKNQIIQKIAELYPGGVLRPENAICLDGPDYIVIYEGSLFGFFIPSKKELQYPDFILRRAFLSKLTYLPSMSTILVCEDGTTSDFQKVTQYAFNQILDNFDHIKENSSLILDSPKRIIKIKGIAEFHKRCAENIWKISKIVEEQKEQRSQYEKVTTEEIGRHVNRWSNRTDYMISDLYLFNDRTLLANKEKSSSSFRESMDGFFNYILFSQFDYDNGRLFWENGMSRSILNTNWNYVDEDGTLNRYGRALAYLGVMPVTTASLNVIDMYENALIHDE